MIEETEGELRRLWESRDYQGAATLAIEAYGPGVFGFLVATLPSEDAASEVFSQAMEDLWRGIEKFQWRAPMRAWMYTIARHAACRYRRSPSNRPSRRVALSHLSEIANAVRTRTIDYLRSQAKSELEEIKKKLTPEDQELLILRINRGMAWTEIALVLSEEPLSDAQLTSAAARVRKQFQRIKERIRRRAKARGLLLESQE